MDMEGLEAAPAAEAPAAGYDALLSALNPAAPVPAAGVPPLARAAAAYTSHDARYRVPQRTYNRQYAQMYFSRLRLMAPAVCAAAEARWPGVRRVTILEVPESVEVVVVGTVYKARGARSLARPLAPIARRRQEG